MELTYKDRLVIKANTRINRLNIERSEMVKNSPRWHNTTRLIGQEKDFIKGLRDGSAIISNHPVVHPCMTD